MSSNTISINGKKVGPIGLGLMGFTTRPYAPIPTSQAIATMKAALNAGANFWNGGDFYGPPDNNSLQLLNAYFTQYPEDADKVVISIKSCFTMSSRPVDGRPESVRKLIDNILEKLEGKCFVDLFEPARVDPQVPFEETLEAVAEYVEKGLIGGIGISETKAETIRKAAAVTKISSVELELSLFSTDPLTNGQAAACAELGIPLVAYSPLGRGFLTGLKSLDDIPKDDSRRMYPRFHPDVFGENLKLVDKVETVAKKKGVSVPQIAMAWVAGLSKREGMPQIIPIPGATTVARVEENVKLVELDEGDLVEINDALKRAEIKGDRYGAFLHEFSDQ